MGCTKIKINNKQDFIKAVYHEYDIGGLVVSTYISKKYNISLYKARKYMKELQAEGLVKKSYIGGFDWENNDYPYCYHGYKLTDKAKETDLFKQIYTENYKKFLNQLFSLQDEPW